MSAETSVADIGVGKCRWPERLRSRLQGRGIAGATDNVVACKRYQWNNWEDWAIFKQKSLELSRTYSWSTHFMPRLIRRYIDNATLVTNWATGGRNLVKY